MRDERYARDAHKKLLEAQALINKAHEHLRDAYDEINEIGEVEPWCTMKEQAEYLEQEAEMLAENVADFGTEVDESTR